MKIIIDEQVKDWKFSGNDTLQQVLLDVNDRVLENGRVIVEIKLDETEPGLDMTLTPDKVTVDQIHVISFKTTLYQEALLSDLEEAKGRLEQTVESIQSVVEQIVGDKIDTAMNDLKDALDVLIWFFDVVHSATNRGYIDAATVEIGGMNIVGYVEKFNTMLTELVTAMKNSDMTLINDYLEYELEPAINAMIASIPDMIASAKKHLDS